LVLDSQPAAHSVALQAILCRLGRARKNSPPRPRQGSVSLLQPIHRGWSRPTTLAPLPGAAAACRASLTPEPPTRPQSFWLCTRGRLDSSARFCSGSPLVSQAVLATSSNALVRPHAARPGINLRSAIHPAGPSCRRIATYRNFKPYTARAVGCTRRSLFDLGATTSQRAIAGVDSGRVPVSKRRLITRRRPRHGARGPSAVIDRTLALSVHQGGRDVCIARDRRASRSHESRVGSAQSRLQALPLLTVARQVIPTRRYGFVHAATKFGSKDLVPPHERSQPK